MRLKSQQRQVLALLVAVAAAVVPLSGSLQYTSFGIGRTQDALVAGVTEGLLGPLLLVGALALAVSSSRHDGPRGLVVITGVALVLAGLYQAAAFGLYAYDLLGKRGLFGAMPATTAWTAVRYGAAAQATAITVLVAGTTWLALRWMTTAREGAST